MAGRTLEGSEMILIPTPLLLPCHETKQAENTNTHHMRAVTFGLDWNYPSPCVKLKLHQNEECPNQNLLLDLSET